MTASLTTPFWSRLITGDSSRLRIYGRVIGEFDDYPWTGLVVSLGDQQSTLKADGEFEFYAPPGDHFLRVCCSERFDSIRRGVRVKGADVFVELRAEPLLQVPGRLIVPTGKELKNPVTVCARRIYTNTVKRAAVSPGGDFSLALPEGDWKVSVDCPKSELIVKAITFGGKQLQDQTITTAKDAESALLEITLQ